MKLREWREAEALTQGEAAYRAGMDQPTWSRIESGKRRATLQQASSILAVTRAKVTLEDLLPTKKAKAKKGGR